jgi:uncharacterized delta-60 repeat protein
LRASFSRDVYPGIDMVYYSRGSDLEYDFQLAPGADPRRIKLRFDGADSLSIDPQSGDLLINTADGVLSQRAPVSYQEIGGTRREVASRFVVENNDVTFRLDAYDRARPLVIDPVIHYSTYLGGNSIDEITGVGVDASGAAYVVSKTWSKDFATVGGPAGQVTSYLTVTKFTPDGNSIAYSTFIGKKLNPNATLQNGTLEATDIAVDAAGNAYVVGSAGDILPTVNALQPIRGGTGTTNKTDAFIFKLNPEGNTLLFSTFHGGDAADYARAVALDASGNAYVVGHTDASSSFPATNRLGYTIPQITEFLTKFSPDGSARTYSTFLPVFVSNVAVDAQGNAYVVGSADNFPANFATSGAFQSARVASECGQCSTDGYLTKINAAGNAVVYSTFISGSRLDSPRAVAVDSTGAAYVVGDTDSKIFPLRNPLQSTRTIFPDVFVVKLAPDGAGSPFATFLGGFGYDYAKDVAVDAAGGIYVVGNTDSPDFPNVDALEGATNPSVHGFITKYAPALNALEFSTLVGGNNSTLAAVAVDGHGSVYVGGQTTATDFPLRNPVDAKITDNPPSHSNHPKADGFLMKLGAAPAPNPPAQPAAPHACTLTAPVNNAVFTAPASVTLNASAVSSRGYIKEVRFFRADTSALVGTATTAPYSATVADLPAENYMFYAVAVTESDELIQSAPIIFTVNAADGSTPGVRITAPASGITVQPGSNLSITVESSPGTQFITLNRNGNTGSQYLGFKFSQNGTFTDINLPAGRHYYQATASINNANVNSRRIFIDVPAPLPTPTPTPTPTPCDPNLDPGFGDCGTARDPFVFGANSLAIDASGKITTSSSLNPSSGSTQYGAASRFHSDGKLDATFGKSYGTGGNVSFYNQYFAPSSVVVQPDGKTVLGNTSYATGAVTVARLNPNGAYDSTFGTNGVVGLGNNYVQEMIGLPDGKTLVLLQGGRMIRLNPNGSCDDTFGNTTESLLRCKTTNTRGAANFARQADGKIVVLKPSSVGSSVTNTLCVSRYTADGLADPTFNTVFDYYGDGGFPTARCVDFSQNIYAGALTIQPDGKIVLAALNDSFAYTDYAVARFNPDGTLDDGTSTDTTLNDYFGTLGKVVVRASSTQNTEDGSVVSALVQPNSNKLVIVGTIGGPVRGGQQGTAIIRFNPDGSLDDGTTNDTTSGDSFGTLGKILSVTGAITARRAALQPDGKLIVAGVSGTLGVARYILDRNTPTPAGTNVRVGVGGLSLTFANVTAAGTTTVTPINPNTAPTPPSGYVTFGGVAYEITTTAQYTGDILIRFTAPSRTTPEEFAKLRILHGEGATLVDRTVVVPDTPAPDFASRTLHARVTSLSPFVLAQAEDVPQILTLAPTGDSYVVGADANRNTNYGTSTEMQIKRTLNPGAGRGRRMFIKFDLANVSSVGSARLRLFARLSDPSLANVPMRIQKVANNAWDELTLTWNTQPDVFSPNAIAPDAVVLDGIGRYYEYDLTTFIQNEIAAGSRFVGFRLINIVPTGNSGAFFTSINSKEATENQPQLVIEP